MSYPILYKADETDFCHLGLGVLKDATECLVTEERNGQFELVMKYPIEGAIFDELKNDRLIKADASPKLRAQRFKIVRITKPAKGIVTVYAEHVSYLTQDLALKPVVNYSGNAQAALSIWGNNIVDEHPFTVYSDIQTEGSGKWTIDKVENARRALGGVEGSILDTYGGEYRFDNYHIGLYVQRGDDSGALIAYGKNLTDLEQDEEIANTYTSVYPYSIVRHEDNTEELITLPEYFVDSEYVENYARRKILTVDFSNEEITTVAQLRARAQRYITDNDVGVPKVNLRVKFIDLAKTLDYKDLKVVEEINLCDLVNVYFEKLGIMQKAKVIKTVWDVLLDRYDSIEIGETRASLSKSIEATVDSKLEPVESRLNIIQVAANGKNTIFRGPDEPQARKVGDLWYKPVGDGEVEMYQWDGAIWKLVVSTAINNEIDTRIQEAKGIAENAENSAQSTINLINNVVQGSGFTTLEDLFASKMATNDFGTLFYQQTNAIGLTYEENGQTKAIIAIADGMPYIKGEHIVLDGDTIVDGTFTVTDNLFAEEMDISKFTTGTLNAANVNLINVNVENLVGNRSEFVRSWWNGINSRISIDGNRLRATHNDGSSTEIGANGIRRITPSDNRNYHYLVSIHTLFMVNRQALPVGSSCQATLRARISKSILLSQTVCKYKTIIEQFSVLCVQDTLITTLITQMQEYL